MKVYQTMLAVCCMFIVTTVAFTQDRQTSHIYLKNGKVKLAENLDQFIEDQTAEQTFKSLYYKIVLFDEIPGEELKNELISHGLEFLDYIPHQAYIIAFPSNFDKSTLLSFKVKSVVDITNSMKMDKYLFNRDYPEWARIGTNQIQLNVQLHKNIDVEEILQELTKYRIYLNSRQDHANLLHLIVDINEIEALLGEVFVKYAEVVAPPPVPEDTEGRSLHRANALDVDYAAGRDYRGRGIKIAINDDGFVGPHVDFKGRTDQTNVAGDLVGDHGDMVAGIAGGAGNVDPTIRGMATEVFLYIRQYISTLPNTATLYQSDTVVLFSSSYSNGCNAGYTTTTELVDMEIYNNPTLIQTFSAGNSGTSDCGYGAGSVWGNITGGHKMGKSVITTGNMDNNGTLQTSSSRGPAHDGRIKPDICANGAGQLSTDPDNNYSPGGGTSAAAPGIAGIMAQLYQAYRDLNGGQYPESPLLKACLLNNAEDRGNPGPDFKYGWGRVNALRAVKTLEENRYLSSTISHGNTNNHNIAVPAGAKELRVMLYWLDPEGSTLASKALVNDLNLKLTAPGGSEYDPWVLDPTPNAVTLDQNAVRGIDTLNNMEQVTLDNPVTGNYTVEVDGHLIPSGPQKYYIVYTFIDDAITVTYPIGGESLVAGEIQKIRWDAFGSAGTFTIQFSSNNGSSWSTITSGISGTSRQYNWTVNNIETAQGLIRINRSGNSIGQCETVFSIYPVPVNLNITGVCPSYTRIEWDAVSGASYYDVYKLGNKFMEIVGSTANTVFDFQGTNAANEDWFSVRAIGPNGEIGRRTLAVQKVPGILNCPVNKDVSINSILSPSGGTLNNCIDLNAVQVTVEIKNPGLQPQGNFPVSYRLNNGTIYTETFSNTLNPGASFNYTFSTTVDLSATGSHTLTSWTSLPMDSILLNDTLSVTVNVISGFSWTLPYTEDFETFSLCGTSTLCETGVCPLGNGWINEENQISDDIDWRTNEGPTPSIGTGPTIDHAPGSAIGNYLYLEASGGCIFQTASMVSPCIDLTGTGQPSLTYWYHMYGNNMGNLHLDVFDGTSWYNDVHTPLTTNQGDVWNSKTVDLSAFTGDKINLRFRGVTGNEFESDIAIDDIQIIDLDAPPFAMFTAETGNACVGETVEFTDMSFGFPTTWSWIISPATYTFVNGTSNSSQHPQIQFTAAGSYNVALYVTNPFGSDNIVKNNVITVNSSNSLPVTEDFESFSLCSTNANCDLTSCNLGNGWVNEENGVYDNIDWRTNEGPTPSTATGPGTDFSPGTVNGNYIYIEASGTCSFQTASLVSPCIDLSGSTSPSIIFGYHMYGINMGELHIDIFNGENWINDIIPAKTGDHGNVWKNEVVDLSAYTGSVIKIRFRGITGSGFESDIALDDINIVDLNQPPDAQFSASVQVICAGESVTFHDESTNYPTSRTWYFNPSTVTFLNGTNINSTNPVVQFNANGSYTVQLAVSNTNGSDILGINNFITVGNGLQLPVNEDFETFSPCSESGSCNIQVCETKNGWINDENSSYDDINWRPDFGGTPSIDTGPSADKKPGTSSGIYLYTETSGVCNAQTANLTSPCIDLSSSSEPYLSFWYHMYGASMGQLHVDIFDGSNWINDIMTPISGDQGNIWKKAVVPLSSYANPSSKLRIRALTGSSYTSDIAIDNISVYDSTQTCPAPKNVFTTVNSLNTATLNWDNVSQASQYRIQGKAIHSASWVYLTVNASQNFYFAEDLNPSWNYHWQVASVCNEEESGYSELDTFSTYSPVACGSPEPISTTNITSTKARLNWSPGTNAVKYEIQGRQAGTIPVTKIYINAPSTTLLATGLTPQTSYEWRVRTLCDLTGSIESDFSSVDVFTTQALPGSKQYIITSENQESKIIPNPFSDKAVLHFDNPSDGTYHLIIRDINGRIVKEFADVHGQEIEVLGTLMESGMYFYQLAGAVIYSGKFVIER